MCENYFEILKPYLLATFFLFFLTQNSFGQEPNEINSRLRNLLQNSERYEAQNLDSALIFANRALKLSQLTGDQRLILECMQRRAVCFYKKGELAMSLTVYDTILKLSDKNDWHLEAIKVSLDIGNVYLDFGKLYDLEEDTLRSGESYRKAVKYYKNAQGHAVLLNDSIWIAKCFQNIASAYFHLALDDKAYSNYKKSGAIFLKYNYQEDYFNILSNLAVVSSYLGYSDSSRIFLEQARVYYQETNNIRGLTVTNYNLAEGFKTKQEWKRALPLLIEADSLVRELQDVSLGASIKESLASVYFEIKDYRKAYENQNLYFSRKSLLTSKELKKDTEIIDYAHEARILKGKVEVQKLRTTIAIYVSSSLLILFITIFFWRQLVNRRNKQLREEQNQKKLKELEIQSMENLLEVRDTERKRIAEDLHDRLGNTLTATRMMFEASGNGEVKVAPQTQKAYKLLDKAIAETRHIAYNMLSGVLTKFGLEAALEDLKTTVQEVSDLQVILSFDNLNERLNAELELNIYRIIQELVSNTLKYAHADCLVVSIKREEDNVRVVVKDDGEGFDSAIVSKGMGLKNIDTRVKKFSGKWSCDSLKGRGTKTVINFTLHETTDQNFNS